MRSGAPDEQDAQDLRDATVRLFEQSPRRARELVTVLSRELPSGLSRVQRLKALRDELDRLLA